MSRANIERANHPYDRGYWARIDGKAKPSNANEAEGWIDADDELRHAAADTQKGGAE